MMHNELGKFLVVDNVVAIVYCRDISCMFVVSSVLKRGGHRQDATVIQTEVNPCF